MSREVLPCFNCQKHGHWSVNCPEKSIRKHETSSFNVQDDRIPCKTCPCGGGTCLVLTSKTQKNPGRKFYKCPLMPPGTKCNFFEWCNTAISDQRREAPQQAFSYPECPCGAGKSRLLTVSKEGPNKGRQFFVCPVKGGTKCNFFEWCDTAISDQRREAPHQAFSYPECPCGAGKSSLLTVSKEGPNKGRQFFVCPVKGGTKCNFFEWCDTAISDQRREAPHQAFSYPECPCGAGKSSLLTVSKEGPNKGRQFFVCPVKGGTKCNFFEWCDTAISDQRREVPQQAFSYPECPCGAGKSSLLTVSKEGPNKGRKYFVCPVKRGQGACNFFMWEDDEGSDRNDGHLGERKPSNSSLSTINDQEETRETNSYSVKDDVYIFDEGSSDEKQSESLSSVGPDVKEMIEICSDDYDDSLSTPMHKLSLSGDKRAVTPTNPGNCFRCGREGHWIRDCSIRATNSVCVKCGRFGHWKKDCTA